MPILIGRPDGDRAADRGRTPCRSAPGRGFRGGRSATDDPRYREYWETYHKPARTPWRHAGHGADDHAHQHHGDRGGHAVYLGHADSMICGTAGQYRWHLGYVRQVLAGIDDGFGRRRCARSARSRR